MLQHCLSKQTLCSAAGGLLSANSGRSEAGATEKWVPAFAMDVICWAGSGPDGKTEDARSGFAQSM